MYFEPEIFLLLLRSARVCARAAVVPSTAAKIASISGRDIYLNAAAVGVILLSIHLFIFLAFIGDAGTLTITFEIMEMMIEATFPIFGAYLARDKG